MLRRKLHNYLRTHRKRAGLSQDEVAFLVGLSKGDKVSRYERRTRLPSLETALACEAVFGVPVSELFAGLYEGIEKETRKRARTLGKALAKPGGDDATARHKLVSLSRLAASEAGDSDTNYEQEE